jgi:hypothetical protein
MEAGDAARHMGDLARHTAARPAIAATVPHLPTTVSRVPVKGATPAVGGWPSHRGVRSTGRTLVARKGRGPLDQPGHPLQSRKVAQQQRLRLFRPYAGARPDIRE